MNKIAQSEAAGPARWLLLIHQLPAKAAYARVKVWRRLQALGAVTVKNSVYALPIGERSLEDFEWLMKEVVASGGEGMICEARLVSGLFDEELCQLFNAAREGEYREAAKAVRALAQAIGSAADAPTRADARSRLKRLKAEVARIFAIDFFGANGRETVAGLLDDLEARLAEETEMGSQHGPEGAVPAQLPKDAVWVTRQGVLVDRIASAWLIRRFIDPGARFKFVPAKGYVPQPGEVRFDMFEAEVTHIGDHCTFEVLLARSGLDDPALAAIAKVVHDIDMKDDKFGRPETGGIASLIEGIAAAHSDDNERLARGAALFDDLYASFKKRV